MTEFTYPPTPHGMPPFDAPRQGMPTWAKILIGLGIATVVFIILICGGLMWFGSVTPDLMAVPGSQMRPQDRQAISDLNLLDPDEKITFFYSDGLLKVEEGMYFFTDERIVIYSESMDPANPLIEVTYPEIIDLTAEFNDSFFDDSVIWIETADEMIPFPVSSEGGGDKRFFQMLRNTLEANRR